MPNFTVDAAPYESLGYVTISFAGGQQGPSWYQWRLYRREGTSGPWTLLQTWSTLQGSYTYQDTTAKANVPYQWVVVEATSTNGGQTINEGPYVPIGATPVGFSYWLIHPTNHSLSMRLPSVNADQFDTTREEEELLIIGRGRKIDRGQEWGVSGNLALKFRDLADGTTGRELRQKFEVLRAEPTFLWLRNPFGDVLKIALFGNTGYEREAGVGMREFVSVTVEYRQVA
jgi:hypothetical protein